MILRLLNLLLILSVILSAFILINKRYKSRTYYTELHNLMVEAEKLNFEYTKLELEKGTYSSNTIVQDYALNKLGFIVPNNQQIMEMK